MTLIPNDLRDPGIINLDREHMHAATFDLFDQCVVEFFLYPR